MLLDSALTLDVIIPGLSLVSHHPLGSELRVILKARPAGEVVSGESSLAAQANFACRYAALLHSRKIFRLSFHGLTGELARPFLRILPVIASRSGNRSVLVVLAAEDLRKHKLKEILQNCNQACVAQGILFFPGFEIDAGRQDWLAHGVECLETAASDMRAVVFCFTLACGTDDPSLISSHYRAVVTSLERLCARFHVQVEFQIRIRIPAARDDLVPFIIGSLLALEGMPATLQLLLEIDGDTPPSPRRRKTSLISEMCWDTLLEFNRTQDYAILRQNLATLSAAIQEGDL